jgi:hypothetical protein
VAQARATAAASTPAQAPGGARPDVRVFTTSLGVRLSYGAVDDRTHLYTFSGVAAGAAPALSSLILLLGPHAGRSELLERKPGLYHLLVTAPAATAAG